MQTDQRDRGHRIARGSWRILQRLAPRRHHSEGLAIGSRLAVEESAGSRIEEARNHRVSDRAGKLEVSEIARRFVGVKTGQRSESVVIEQSGYFAMLGRRVGVGNHMQQQGLCAVLARRMLPR